VVCIQRPSAASAQAARSLSEPGNRAPLVASSTRRSRTAFCLEYPTPFCSLTDLKATDCGRSSTTFSGVYDQVVEPFFSRPIFEEVGKLLASLASRRKRILDCSCGPGTEALLLAALVPEGEVVGSEAPTWCSTAAAKARQRGVKNVAFFAGRTLTTCRSTRSSSISFIARSRSPLLDPVQSFQQMHRALRTDGHAFVIDAGPWWMKALASPLAKWGDPDGLHSHRG